MIWIWLGVVVSLLLIEYMSRNFTAICFAISGIISCILTHFDIQFKFHLMGCKITLTPYIIQLLVFLIVGIFLILVVRPHFLNFIEKKKQEKKAMQNKENLKKKEKKKKKRKK